MTRSNSALGIPFKSDQILVRQGFTAGYSVEHQQSLWVSYILKGENLALPPFPREKFFAVDPDVKGIPAKPQDYTRTGFDRGHLAPAADMAYSEATMKESFLMSNISPQIPECNRIRWLEAEKLLRQWAAKEQMLYVITGPCFAPGKNPKLGNTSITVPQGFFKAVMDLTEPCKMIACYVENAPGCQLRFISVDELEQLTGGDFFDLLEDDWEESLECQFDIMLWSTGN